MDETSALTDTVQDNLLAPPVYTRPSNYKGMEVPPGFVEWVIFQKLKNGERNKAMERTTERRPDLLKVTWKISQTCSIYAMGGILGVT